MSPLVILLALVSSFGAIGLALTLIHEEATAAMTGALGERLQAFERPLAATLEDAELEPSFAARVIKPMLESLGKKLSRGRSERSGTDRLLDAAGRPHGLTSGAFNALVFLCVVVLATVSYVLVLVTGQTGRTLILGPLGGLLLGGMTPRMWLSRKAKRRANEIKAALPSACDLLVVSVEAGLSIDGAMSRVADRYQNALGEQFAMTLRTIQLGMPRPEAFTAMSQRCGVEDVEAFVRAINQSQDMGTGLGRVLRLQSEELRRRRRERAAQKGAQAPLKMLFPMIGCIFPTLFIVLLGPAVLQISSASGK